MSDLIWLTKAQMRRIEPYFPLSHGVPRVDDQRIISGIIFVIRNGLRWRDAPKEYGPHKTIYNRFIRWSRLGVFNRIFAALSAKGGKPDRLMIDATHLKAHRTAASLLKKGLFPTDSLQPKVSLVFCHRAEGRGAERETVHAPQRAARSHASISPHSSISRNRAHGASTSSPSASGPSLAKPKEWTLNRPEEALPPSDFSSESGAISFRNGGRFRSESAQYGLL